MQKFLALLAVAGLASAQTANTLPTCATACVGNSVPAECNLEPSCICSSTTFIDAISCCVANSCNEADQQATLDYARTICTPAGVTNLPTAAGCANNGTASSTSGSSASASGTGSVAQSASSVVSSLSASASEAEATASSAIESASSAASEAAASATQDAAGRVSVQGLGVVGGAMLGLAALF